MFRNLNLIIVLCLLFGNAWADDKIYATVGGGWTIPTRNANIHADSGFTHYGPTAAPSGESFFNLPAVDWQFKYDNGFNINAALGYKLYSSVRADVEFLYLRFKRNITGTYGWSEYDALTANILDSRTGIVMAPSASHVNVYSILTNGYYDFHTSTKWTPLLGAGFGVAWIKSAVTTANGSFTTPVITASTPTLQVSPSFSGTAFAWQLKAGVAYDYSKRLAVIMQYRLFATTTFVADPSSITTNPNASAATRRVFRVSQQTVRGLTTSSLELQLKFGLAS